MINKYTLIGRLALPCEDVLAWCRWLETADRRVARDEIGPLVVSTVFIGLNHNYGEGDPQLFETMIFDLELSEHIGLGGRSYQARNEIGYLTRCATWGEAEQMHQDGCVYAREWLAQRLGELVSLVDAVNRQ